MHHSKGERSAGIFVTLDRTGCGTCPEGAAAGGTIRWPAAWPL